MPILSSIIEKDIAIDLGTDTTILYVAGIGIRLREPTVVTIDRTTGRVLKVGEDARKMLGRTPGNLVSVHPIAAGVISDYDMTCEMLREFIRRVTSFSLFRSRVLVCVPGSITGVEERAIVNAVIEAGAKVSYAIVGEGCHVGKNAVVGGTPGSGSGREPRGRSYDHRYRRRHNGSGGRIAQRRGGVGIHQNSGRGV